MTEHSKIQYETEWRERYHFMVTSARKALARLKPGNRVFVGTGCAEPVELVEALVARAGDLADVEVVHLLTKGEALYANPKLAASFRVNSFFIGSNIREHIQEGMGSYTPVLLSDIPRLFSSGQIPLDAALIQVTPPDIRGKVSLGISVDIVKSAAENASLVIALVNPNMPWTHGDSIIDVQDLDLLVPTDSPIIERVSEEIAPEIRQIGENIASLVADGSTIEFGIGRIPQSLVEFLKGKKELGIHTEMLTDSIVDLVEAGAVTGNRKTLDRGRIVASFCMGSKRLYDYIDDNPMFSFHPTEYVNDTAIISRQHKMVAINMALEIDLTGQVCADSLGSKFFSGIGGQVDFNRGAVRSRGGKAIIAMPTTAKDGSVSRIVTKLSEGAGVVTTRGEVQYVVTEFGIAYLFGKSIQERAMALISIAHPDFREKLLHEAIEAHYIPRDFADIEGKFMVASRSLKTTMLLEDGTQITFRPIHPTDEPSIRGLHYQLSQETVYYRFMTRQQKFAHQQLKDYVYIDHRKDVCIVGTIPEVYGEEIIAVGRYYLDERTNYAEVAFVIHDKWQNRHIGRFMFNHLKNIAIQNGIAGFTAEVLRDNKRMQQIINSSSCRVRSKLSEDAYSFEMDFQ